MKNRFAAVALTAFLMCGLLPCFMCSDAVSATDDEIPEDVYSIWKDNGHPADELDKVFAEKKRSLIKDYVYYCECENTGHAFTAEILTDIDPLNVSYFDAVPLKGKTLDISPALCQESPEPGCTRYRNTVSGSGKYSQFVFRFVCDTDADPEQCIVRRTVSDVTVNGLSVPDTEAYMHLYKKYTNSKISRIGMLALGDVNKDNQVDVTDANLIIQYSGGGSNAPAINDRGKLAADVNLDGVVDLDDAVQILTYIANYVPHVWGNC